MGITGGKFRTILWVVVLNLICMSVFGFGGESELKFSIFVRSYENLNP